MTGRVLEHGLSWFSDEHDRLVRRRGPGAHRMRGGMSLGLQHFWSPKSGVPRFWMGELCRFQDDSIYLLLPGCRVSVNRPFAFLSAGVLPGISL